MEQGPIWLSLLGLAAIFLLVARRAGSHFRRPFRQLLAFVAGWLAIALVLALIYRYAWV
jgi:hypothetical protein